MEDLQAVYQAMVITAAQTVDAEPDGRVTLMRTPEGAVAGEQITVDATEKGGMLNLCRLTVLNPLVAPNHEVVRLEYERDKQGKFGPQRVYSIQSLRQTVSGLALMEDFLAGTAAEVREADFRPITSIDYARESARTLEDWSKYRAWQRQEGK